LHNQLHSKKFGFIILLNVIIVLAEIFYGLVSNSTALIADAVHNLSDILAIVITFVALYFSHKSPSKQNTLGYIRAEMMATFNNSLFLIVIMFYVMYESINGLMNFDEVIVDGGVMMIVATIALIANSWSAYLLHQVGVHHSHEHGKENINIKSAYLHFLADSLLSVAVVIGGALIYFFEIFYIDKILALIFALYIIGSTLPLLRDSFYSLMDIRHSIDIDQIEAFILKFAEVDQLHDVHIVEPSPRHSFFYAHLVLNRDLTLKEIEHLNSAIEQGLKRFGINHSVIQPETQDMRENSMLKREYGVD